MSGLIVADRPATSKSRMYDMLARGLFGNTIPQYFSLEAWRQAPRAAVWGVRSLTPGGPCRLFCPEAEVEDTVTCFLQEGHGVNISLMVDTVRVVTLWADVYDTDTGLIVYGIEYPPKGASWRAMMPVSGRQWEGVTARSLLRKHLNPSSLEDLYALLERWPGHVVELSACDRPIGIVPGRNAVVWEVRQY